VVLPASVPVSTLLDARSSRSLSDFTVTPYAAKEGAPANVNWLTQTPDGFLWLSTSTGLVRFDGVGFERGMAGNLPDESSSTMFADKNGDLWVGFADGRIAHGTNNVFTEIDQGLPKEGRTIWSIVRDPAGTLWATSGYGIYRLDGAVWKEVGQDIGPGTHSVYGLAGLLDDGRLFVANNHKVWFQVRGTQTFEPGDIQQVWKSRLGFDYTQLPPGAASDKLKAIVERPPGVSLRIIYRDRTGTIWALSDDIERFRWITSSAGERRLVVDTLDYNAAAYMLLPDREGNLWSASVDGVRRLRPNKFMNILPKDAASMASLAEDGHGNVWIAPTQAGYTYAVASDGAKKWSELGQGFASVSSDHEGNIWLLKNDADPKNDDIRMFNDGQVMRIPYPDGLNGRAVENMLDDPAGGHVLITTLGLYRYQAGAWLPHPVYPDLPKDPPRGARSDRFGRLWIMYTNNRVALVDKSGDKLFSSADGVAVGDPWSVYVGRRQTWLVGLEGVAYLRHNRFVSMTPSLRSNGESLKRIVDVVEADNGDLWMNAEWGVIHIARSEIDRFLNSPGYQPVAEILNEDDGLQGGAYPENYAPSLLLDGAHRLWVARLQGVSWIDLDHIPRNAIAPDVSFTSIEADGKALSPKSEVSLPALTRMVHISYTAPSLSMPERVRFSVKLRGFDADWRDVGASRTATYTNLGPGKYKFVVRAANEDGTWSAHDALLAFTIAPAFYQTWWFRSIIVLIALGVLWLLFSLRLRQIQSRLHLQLAATHGERERIARELHDTLMQGIQGLVLQVQWWSKDSVLSDERRKDMNRAAGLATSMLMEGRDRITEMRNASYGDTDLAQGLREVCEDCSKIYNTSFTLSPETAGRVLRPECAREVLNIGREAVRNAFAHAGASEIRVHVQYSAAGLQLGVRDDGVGIPLDILDERVPAGHWGIIGMKERAKRIDSFLIIRRRETGGTELLLDVPARVIYLAQGGRLDHLIHLIWSRFTN
jgi:signal transduction histidine kinase/ligand-binding sensor domain-containing protein